MGPKSCYLLAEKLFESYLQRHKQRPSRLILDLDTTDDPLHGQQELRYFSAYYDEYVYQPLLIFDQDGDLIASVLQPGKSQGTRPAVAVLKRIIHRLRKKWPGVSILVRGDSGFASPELYRLCRTTTSTSLSASPPTSGLGAWPQNSSSRLPVFPGPGNRPAWSRLSDSLMGTDRKRWPRSYRIIIKAEHTEQGSNVRFVVTNLAGDPQKLYDRCYVQRADACEDSIKDLKRALKADRLSCHRFWANQFRLLLHAAAYVLMYMLRRAAPAPLADADGHPPPAPLKIAGGWSLQPVASGFIWPPAIPGSHFGLASPGGCYRRSPSAESPTFPSPSIPPPLGRSPALSRPLRGPQSEKPGTGPGTGTGTGTGRSGTRRRWLGDRQRCRLMNNPG